jgi:hypothetical protein
VDKRGVRSRVPNRAGVTSGVTLSLSIVHTASEALNSGQLVGWG